MHLTYADKSRLSGAVTVVREPNRPDVAAQSDPKVISTVSDMLSTIEAKGIEAVRDYAERLDGWKGGTAFEITPADADKLTADLPADLREALDAGAERTQRFARYAACAPDGLRGRSHPGRRLRPEIRAGGHRGRLPAGRQVPAARQRLYDRWRCAGGRRAEHRLLHASLQQWPGHPAVLYSARVSGAERIFALGGVQALAAMAFGLLDASPADMIVGAGNAFVAEAKRQLYGTVGIDVLAGPSEVAVIADDTASAAMVAADLLAQAEHGPTSPACLVTTSHRLAAEVEVEIERQLRGLATGEIAGAAWRDWGSIYVADSAADRRRSHGHPGPRAP